MSEVLAHFRWSVHSNKGTGTTSVTVNRKEERGKEKERKKGRKKRKGRK